MNLCDHPYREALRRFPIFFDQGTATSEVGVPSNDASAVVATTIIVLVQTL